jgi:hypothetical protein
MVSFQRRALSEGGKSYSGPGKRVKVLLRVAQGTPEELCFAGDLSAAFEAKIDHGGEWSYKRIRKVSAMRPGGGGRPTGDLASRIESAFGNYEKFASRTMRA